jgi:hypothetical protein
LLSFNYLITEAIFIWHQVIGLSGGAVLAITAQGIDDFDEVAFLTDEKVTTLWKTVCKPGGAVVGQVITLTSESSLYLLCFYLQHLKHCSRTAIVGQMTLQAIQNLRLQSDQENNDCSCSNTTTIHSPICLS